MSYQSETTLFNSLKKYWIHDDVFHDTYKETYPTATGITSRRSKKFFELEFEVLASVYYGTFTMPEMGTTELHWIDKAVYREMSNQLQDLFEPHALRYVYRSVPKIKVLSLTKLVAGILYTDGDVFAGRGAIHKCRLPGSPVYSSIAANLMLDYLVGRYGHMCDDSDKTLEFCRLGDIPVGVGYTIIGRFNEYRTEDEDGMPYGRPFFIDSLLANEADLMENGLISPDISWADVEFRTNWVLILNHPKKPHLRGRIIDKVIFDEYTWSDPKCEHHPLHQQFAKLKAARIAEKRAAHVEYGYIEAHDITKHFDLIIPDWDSIVEHKEARLTCSVRSTEIYIRGYMNYPDGSAKFVYITYKDYHRMPREDHAGFTQIDLVRAVCSGRTSTNSEYRPKNIFAVGTDEFFNKVAMLYGEGVGIVRESSMLSHRWVGKTLAKFNLRARGDGELYIVRVEEDLLGKYEESGVLDVIRVMTEKKIDNQAHKPPLGGGAEETMVEWAELGSLSMRAARGNINIRVQAVTNNYVVYTEANNWHIRGYVLLPSGVKKPKVHSVWGMRLIEGKTPGSVNSYELTYELDTHEWRRLTK